MGIVPCRFHTVSHKIEVMGGLLCAKTMLELHEVKPRDTSDRSIHELSRIEFVFHAAVRRAIATQES